MRQFGLLITAVGYALAAQSPVVHSLDAGIASVNAMTQDSAGNLYLTGTATSTQFPVTTGAYQTHFHDDGFCDYVGNVVVPCSEAFVMKLDATGKVLWATLLGGRGSDYSGNIAVDSAGNVYLAGVTEPDAPLAVGGHPNDFPVTADALFPNPTLPNGPVISGPVDGFLSILSPDGKGLIYSTYLPGLQGVSMALGPEDSIYLAGTVDQGKSSIRPTPGAFQTAFRGTGTTVLVMKLKARGTALAYATYLGGSHGEESGPIDVDSSGNVYVAGVTDSADFPVTAGSLQTRLPHAGGSAFVAKVSPDGSQLVYATFLGGSHCPIIDGSCNNVVAIKLTSGGDIWLTGRDYSDDFPVTAGALPVLLGEKQYGAPFISKLSANGASLIYSTRVPAAASTYAGPVSLDVDAQGNAYYLGHSDYGFPVTAGAFEPCRAVFDDLLALQFGPNGQLTGATYLGATGNFEGGKILATGDGRVAITGATRSLDFLGTAAKPDPQSPGFAVPMDFVAKIQINDSGKQNPPCMSSAVLNAANFAEAPAAPGEIVTLFGYGFGPETAAYAQIGANGRIANELAGVRVLFDDVPAPLLYAQSRQINAIVPWQLAGRSSVKVRVDYNGVSTNSPDIRMAASLPGIFLVDYFSHQAAVLNENGTVNSKSNPAKLGSVISIFATGGGLFDLSSSDGSLTPLQPPFPRLTLPVEVLFRGEAIEPESVLYAGAAPGLISGAIQINARVPNKPDLVGFPISVELVIGGQRSEYGVQPVVWLK